MENAPETKKMTLEEIDAEVARLSKEKIKLDEELGHTHFESGDNSLDDQAQEQVMDDQADDIKIAQINHIQDEINALMEKKGLLKKVA